MWKSIKAFYRRKFYGEETHNILNYLTLQIDDKEIAKEYELYRIKRFNNVFWPLAIIFLIFNIGGWYGYAQGGSLASALRPLHQWIVLFIIAIPRYFFNR